jgi:RNA ligase
MRTLATIQTIKSLDPLPEKDKIVLASFENTGWHVIVGKDDFKVGDKCIYVEADSILPQRPEFEFLRKRCWNEKWQGFRIRNMKMAQTFSEGIAFPQSIIAGNTMKSIPDGVDVTEQLGIIKYDPEALAEAKLLEQRTKKYGPFMRFMLRIPIIKKLLYPKRKSTSFPKWAHMSDETRVQVLPYVYEDYKGVKVYVTEKLDGQSCLFGMVHREFVVCSRRMRLPAPRKIKGKWAEMKNKYWESAEKFDVKNKLQRASKELGIDLYVQGEQCGPGISGNRVKWTELKFYIFNIYDVTHAKYFAFEDMVSFCAKYGFEMVPLLEITDFRWENVDALIAYAKGNSVITNTELREGIVIRSYEPKQPGRGMAGQASFKVINPDFDLKWHGAGVKEEEE